MFINYQLSVIDTVTNASNTNESNVGLSGSMISQMQCNSSKTQIPSITESKLETGLYKNASICIFFSYLPV